MHTLLFQEAGHFHAALLLREMNHRVDRSVHVYAEAGPDLDRFEALVRGFNSRALDPTDWDLHLHEGPAPLERLIAERRGELAVVAGRNATKLATIRRLHDAGLAVLADKPWLVSSDAVADLVRVTAGPPLAMDLMTERQDVAARLQQRVVATESVFGRFATADDGPPAIEFRSVHHLCKTVDGRPLRRPEWYYDVRIQGDGLVDIQSHLVDRAQWLVETTGPSVSGSSGPGSRSSDEAVIDRAQRWTTPVPLELFIESTGASAFPSSMREDVDGGMLHLACNGRIDYRLRGVTVRQDTRWEARQPPGGGDAHTATARGTGATVIVRHGPETGGSPQIHLDPTGTPDLAARVSNAMPAWQEEFPGLEAVVAETSGKAAIGAGLQLVLPTALRTPHETNFARVLDEFLDHVERSVWPSDLAKRIRQRYTLLARAQEIGAAPETSD